MNRCPSSAIRRLPLLGLIAAGAGSLLAGCAGSAPVAPAPTVAPTPAASAAPAATTPAAPATPVAAAAPVAAAPVATTATPGWEWVGWGGGGHMITTAFHPTRDGVVYVGGDVNGCFKSEDYGRHFRICNDGLSNYGGYAIATDAKRPDTIYMGTPGGICRSRDAGEHWTFLPKTGAKELKLIFNIRGVHPLVVDANSGALLAGSTTGAIFRSGDEGESWQEVHAAPATPAKSDAILSLTTGTRSLAVTAGAVLLASSDGGTTWATATAPEGVIQIAQAPGNAQSLYAACGEKGVATSTDGGASWTMQRNGLDAKDGPFEIVVDPSDAKIAHAVARGPGVGGAVVRSIDGGVTWTRIKVMKRDIVANPTLPEEAGPGSKDLAWFSRPTAIAIDPRHPQQLFIAADWRSAGSEDGGVSWTERDHGADMTCVHDIRFLNGTAYVTAMDEGLLASADQGATWNQLAPRKWSQEISGHQWRVMPQQLPDGRVRVVSLSSPWDAQGNRVLLSEDGGKSFTIVKDGLPEKRPTINTMWGQGYGRALAADPNDPAVLYLGIDGDPDPATGFQGGGIFKSSDGGHHWQQLAKQPGSRRMFYGLAVDPTDSKRIFWGGCKDNGGLYRSEDGGETWSQVFNADTWVFNVAVGSDGAVYCPGKQLWRSTDHGTIWTQVTNFTEGGTIVGLELHPTDAKTWWVSRVNWGDSATGRISKTTDGGATWQDITGDIAHRNALVLRYDPASHYLWAGSVGLYRLKQ